VKGAVQRDELVAHAARQSFGSRRHAANRCEATLGTFDWARMRNQALPTARCSLAWRVDEYQPV
jgi:hypothetical protein